MRARVRLNVLAALIGAAWIAGCSGATDPNPGDDPAQLATQLDSQYLALLTRSTECAPDYYGRRACDMYFVETPAAFGARAADVEVSIDGAVETWKGYEVEMNHSFDGGATFDTTLFLTAFRGSDLRRYLIAEYVTTIPAPQLSAVLFMDDTSEYRTRSGRFFTIRTLPGGACASPSQLANPDVMLFRAYVCTPALYATSLELTLQGDPGAPSAQVRLSIDSQNFPGVRFTSFDTVGTSHSNRVRPGRSARRSAQTSVDSPHVPE